MSTVTAKAADLTFGIDELSFAEPLYRLHQDLKKAARVLSRENTRWLVDRYYEVQESRKRSSNQYDASKAQGEPDELITWTFKCDKRCEASIKAILGEFAASYRVGAWLQSITGIGAVLSAGVLVNFKIEKAPTAGHFWRFAGLDPTLKWPGRDGARKIVEEALGTGPAAALHPLALERIHDATGQHTRNIQRIFNDGYKPPKGPTKTGKAALCAWLARRPWNARLKAFCCFRMGETQVSFCNHPKSYYGPLYSQMKRKLEKANEAGEFAETAAWNVENKTVGKTTEAWKAYSTGQLPQGQIHNRARRWMVKLFLSHVHHAMYNDYYGVDPPAPYIFDHPDGTSHRHLLLPPGWPGDFGGRSLRDLQ